MVQHVDFGLVCLVFSERVEGQQQIQIFIYFQETNQQLHLSKKKKASGVGSNPEAPPLGKK